MRRGPKPIGKLEPIADILPKVLPQQPPNVPRPRKFICYLCPRHDPFWSLADFQAHLDRDHRT